MSGVHSLIEQFEQAGGTVTIKAGTVRVRYPETHKQAVAPILSRLREYREEVARLLRERLAGPDRVGVEGQEIPAGTVLIAPRYDSKPLNQVPSCWCCATPYKLEREQEWQRQEIPSLRAGVWVP